MGDITNAVLWMIEMTMVNQCVCVYKWQTLPSGVITRLIQLYKLNHKIKQSVDVMYSIVIHKHIVQ